MRKLIPWAGAALFIVVVMAIVFRVGKLRTLVTGAAAS